MGRQFILKEFGGCQLVEELTDQFLLKTKLQMNLKRYFLHSSSALLRFSRISTNLFQMTHSTAAWDAAPSKLKGVFCGSGSDMMNDPRPAKIILNLVNKPVQDTQILYLGTATYDIDQFQVRQTQRFSELGCKVKNLKVSDKVPNDIEEVIDEADVIIVGGGNTLYAVDRWSDLNMIPLLRRAMARGVVMTGGSAGAICWFDGGHSGRLVGWLLFD